MALERPPFKRPLGSIRKAHSAETLLLFERSPWQTAVVTMPFSLGSCLLGVGTVVGALAFGLGSGVLLTNTAMKEPAAAPTRVERVERTGFWLGRKSRISICSRRQVRLRSLVRTIGRLLIATIDGSVAGRIRQQIGTRPRCESSRPKQRDLSPFLSANRSRAQIRGNI